MRSRKVGHLSQVKERLHWSSTAFCVMFCDYITFRDLINRDHMVPQYWDRITHFDSLGKFLITLRHPLNSFNWTEQRMKRAPASFPCAWTRTLVVMLIMFSLLGSIAQDSARRRAWSYCFSSCEASLDRIISCRRTIRIIPLLCDINISSFQTKGEIKANGCTIVPPSSQTAMTDNHLNPFLVITRSGSHNYAIVSHIY